MHTNNQPQTTSNSKERDAAIQIITTNPITAQALFDLTFFAGRPARSKPYRQGVMDALRFKLGEAEHIQCPYQQGSVEFDAYFSGIDEGQLRYSLRKDML